MCSSKTTYRTALPRHASLLPALVLLLAGTGVAVAQQPQVAPPADSAAQRFEIPDVEGVGRFDYGKMWTFDHPPVDYFRETYDFNPDADWFERARLGALRLPNCSASFVSPYGLVLTNHHCVREYVTAVSQPDESLLDEGFYATSLDAERAAEEAYADQLIEIEDITERIYAGLDPAGGDDRQAEVRENRADRIEELMTAEVKQRDTTLFVEVIPLYHGARYAAYTFKRYHDVRLVMAPELKIGFYGGEPDNFTYPRYNLDASFLRVYEDDEPFRPEHYFPVDPTGSEPGEPVFVIGNPGSTSRLSTISQLLFERDHALPQQLSVLQRRADILRRFIQNQPEEAERFNLRNTYFSIMNSIKALTGQLEGLHDPDLMATRLANERQLRLAISMNDSLSRAFGGIFDQIEGIQRAKEATMEQASALALFTSELGSHILTRAAYGYLYDRLRKRAYPFDQLEELRQEALQVTDWPAEVEKAFIAARFEEMQQHLGPNDPTLRRVLGGRTPREAAEQLVDSTALIDSTGFARMLEKGYSNSGDPTHAVAEALTPLYFTLGQQQDNLEQREENLNARLAQARFALFGTRIPPDASFSLRIADGVVAGYAYNGTRAPAYTTFYGLYDHFHAYGEDTDWDLPERWLNTPATFDRATPLNLVTTNDITGGNSGSPLLDRELRIVGLIFDGNMESLPNEYLYRNERARAVSVDVRGILEALDDVYDADRLVYELQTGRLAETEEEADAAMAQ